MIKFIGWCGNLKNSFFDSQLEAIITNYILASKIFQKNSISVWNIRSIVKF